MRSIQSFKGEYQWLSNFFVSPFKLQNKIWKTVEHYYQAAKTSNLKEKNLILSIVYPGQAKKYGRTVKLKDNWEEIKDIVMLRALRAKFEQNPDLGKKLIDTKDSYLEEGNFWHDNYWGVCYCGKRCNGSGLNRLGTLLMQVRKEINQ
jgi:ribA/ribD-fused uncharacterized protein